MLPDRVSNPGPLTYESGALPIAKLWKKKYNVHRRRNASVVSFCICFMPSSSANGIFVNNKGVIIKLKGRFLH